MNLPLNLLLIPILGCLKNYAKYKMLCPIYAVPEDVAIYFLLLCVIIVGIVTSALYLLYNAKPETIRENWGIVEEKVYPMTYEEAVATAALHFTELGVAATIVATILLVNAVSACYLRSRILKEGRFFEPFASDMQDSEWVDDDEEESLGSRGGRGGSSKRKAP